MAREEEGWGKVSLEIIFKGVYPIVIWNMISLNYPGKLNIGLY